MRNTLLLLCAVALVVSGCVTAPPAASVIETAKPKTIGPESGYVGTGVNGAHDWTDDDARTALWLRRNLPERWAEIPFPIISFFRYNIHHDRQQYMPFAWDYYFADMRDPHLQVRMFTLESRDRNRVRREGVLAEEAAREAAAEKAVTEDVSGLSDDEVLKKLQTVYP